MPFGSHLKVLHVARSLPASKSIFHHQNNRRRRAEANVAVCSIKARWCIDIKYGVKMEAISLVQDWIQSVGSLAGLQQANTNLLSGAVGASESRLEVRVQEYQAANRKQLAEAQTEQEVPLMQLEVEFETLALLEQFWAAIPPEKHKAWSQRARNYIIDGSPRWEIYRTCPVFATERSPDADPVSATLKAWESASASKTEKPETASSILEEYLKGAKENQSSEGLPSQSLLSGLRDDGTPDSSGRRIALDWKGDPMIINPGDNMPLF